MQLLLGQLIDIADKLKVPVGPKPHEIFERLQLDSGSTDPVVTAASVKAPSAAELLAVHLKSERPRYAADVAYEAKHEALLAARFLSEQDVIKNPVEVVLAIELLADRAVATPGWQTTPIPVPALEKIETAAEIAKSISLVAGTSLIIAGLDSASALVRVECCDGTLGGVQKESLATFSGRALSEWSKQYPYGYADDNAHANVFYLSTEPLQFAPLPSSPVLVVASTKLQSLPLNLWRIGESFAGMTHAMAAVPSLSWLRAARAIITKPGRRKLAWISTSEEQGGTLAMVADRLGETLSTHNVYLNTSSAVPGDFIGAKLAIVTAHGGIAPGGKSYFTRISDEGGLSVNGVALASALRNIDVVILFVCSGGRTDKSPTGETTSGMAKQLLGAGCSAVIASPWPLDPRITYHWLPTFMDTWHAGANLADANFSANRKVDAAFPGEFSKTLAMHVLGNPFIGYD